MKSRPYRARYSRPLVLIVDDDVEALALNALSLTGLGFDVVPSSEARDALERTHATAPDVIVTAISAVKDGGWTLTRTLKSDRLAQRIPIVVLTRDPSARMQQQAIDEGCAAVLLKSSGPHHLARRLREILEGAAPPRERPSPAGTFGHGASEPEKQVAKLPPPTPPPRTRMVVASFTTAPDVPPPQLFCPSCGSPLVHRQTVISGVKPIERWDYMDCRKCGRFIYRERTRKLRRAT